LPFLLVAAAAYSIAKTNPSIVYNILAITVTAMLLQAALVIVFRIVPDLEMAWLSGELSRYVSGPNVIAGLLDDSGRNNVLDTAKAGGVFVNANIAAAYLGIGALTAVLVARGIQLRLMWLVGSFLWGSVFFTGSKAGILLALFLPMAALAFVYHVQFDRWSKALLITGGLAAGSIMFILGISTFDVLTRHLSFVAASVDTASTRLLIWSFAGQEFWESPWLGQGFGGWQLGYESYALELGVNPYPPHNTLINLWSQSGFAAVVLGLAFIFSVMRLAYRAYVPFGRHESLNGLILGLVGGWILIQGMGENWGLFGDPRLQPFFATAIGLAYATLRRRDLRQSSGDAGMTVSRSGFFVT
jgi:O-antigen ligase